MFVLLKDNFFKILLDKLCQVALKKYVKKSVSRLFERTI